VFGSLTAQHFILHRGELLEPATELGHHRILHS